MNLGFIWSLEFCRFLAQLMTNHQLGELVTDYPEVFQLIANCTVTGLQVGTYTEVFCSVLLLKDKEVDPDLLCWFRCFLRMWWALTWRRNVLLVMQHHTDAKSHRSILLVMLLLKSLQLVPVVPTEFCNGTRFKGGIDDWNRT